MPAASRPRAAARPPITDDKQRKILAAALALFADRGFHGTTIPDVIDRAGVGASTLYRHFGSKEELVNAVFRDAKGRLARALTDGLDASQPPRVLFGALWERLARFARAEPVAFHFLELQDHAPYLDARSRSVELSLLGPLYLALHDFQKRRAFRADLAPDALMAFVWGAFVGLIKAERTGYLALTDGTLRAARDACLRAFATSRAG